MVIPEGSNTKEWAGTEEAQVVQETGVGIRGVATTPRPEGQGPDEVTKMPKDSVLLNRPP